MEHANGTQDGVSDSGNVYLRVNGCLLLWLTLQQNYQFHDIQSPHTHTIWLKCDYLLPYYRWFRPFSCECCRPKWWQQGFSHITRCDHLTAQLIFTPKPEGWIFNGHQWYFPSTTFHLFHLLSWNLDCLTCFSETYLRTIPGGISVINHWEDTVA